MLALATGVPDDRPSRSIPRTDRTGLFTSRRLGAPADVFASADTEWIDYLASRKLVRPDTRVDLLGNRLVLVAAAEELKTELPLTAAAIDKALGYWIRVSGMAIQWVVAIIKVPEPT